MYKFIKLPDEDNKFDSSSIEMVITKDVSLPDLLQEFECFLKACGFVFEGELDIIQEEVEND
jgi:hypothetical protein